MTPDLNTRQGLLLPHPPSPSRFHASVGAEEEGRGPLRPLTRVGGEELWRQADGQRALGDELSASPRSDTALHDRANSFQAAEGRGGGRKRGQYMDVLCLGPAPLLSVKPSETQSELNCWRGGRGLQLQADWLFCWRAC